MLAKNRKKIEITGAIFMKLMAKDLKGKYHIAKEMIYISSYTDKFFLS